MNMWN